MDYSLGIHKWRMQRGYSLDYLSEKSGISKAYLSDLEHGRKSPTLKKYFQLCKALEVCPHVMINYDFFCKDNCSVNCVKCMDT